MRRENFALFSLETLQTQPDGEQCYICFLSGASRAIIISALRYTSFLNTRWFVDDETKIGEFSSQERDEIEQYYEQAKVDVIMACNAQDLVDVGRMLVAAVAGEAVTLSDPLPASVDYTSIGISPKMDEIIAILTGMATESDDMEEILDAILVILGGVTVL